MRKSALTRIGMEILLLVISGLAFFAFGGCFLFGQSNLIPPELPLVTDLRCQVDPTAEGWKATAIVSYVNPERHHGGTPWIVPIEEFKNKNRKKARARAENACNEWLDAVNKVRAEIMPIDAKKEKHE